MPDPGPVPARSATDEVASAVDGFLQHGAVERGLSPRTVEAYGRDLMRFADFTAAVRGEREPSVPIAEAIETTRILAALHRSLESGAVEAV